MTNSTCIVDACGRNATRMVDPDLGVPLLCDMDYQRWWRDRKDSGEGALTEMALVLPCRCGCDKKARVTGARRRKYQEEGKLPFASIECRDRGKKVEVPCAGCGRTLEKYRSYVEKSRTGRFICDTCRADGVGCKPRKGKTHVCKGCGVDFYRRPGDDKATFHSKECRKEYEEKHLQIDLVCPVDGVEFKVWKSQYDRGYRHCSRECRDIGSIKNVVPGGWHNGKPKRYHKAQDGYILIWQPDHHATYQGWVFEHRWVVEQSTGVRLTSNDEVDHINEVKSDNRLENLRVLSGSGHASVTGRSTWAKRKARDEELEEYRRLFGPLATEEAS